MMKLAQARKVMGANLIPPQVLADHLGAEFSEQELEQLDKIPIQREGLLAPDFYEINRVSKKDFTKQPLIKDTHILFPVATKVSFRGKSFALNVSYLFELLGFARDKKNKSRICFTKRELTNKDWWNWLPQSYEAKPRKIEGVRIKNTESTPIKGHPFSKGFDSVGWRMIRKQAPKNTLNKNFDEAVSFLKAGDSIPTLLEILIMIASYYFWIKDPENSDYFVRQPFWENRDIHARLLYSTLSWTSDKYMEENLVVGLNDARGGIYIYPTAQGRTSFLTGILPIRDLID